MHNNVLLYLMKNVVMRFVVIFGLVLLQSTVFAVSESPIPTTTTSSRTLVKSQLTDISCQFCLDHVDALKNALDAKMTKASIVKLVKEIFCVNSGKDTSIRNTLIDDYLPKVLKSMEHEKNHQLICYNSMLCPEPNKYIPARFQNSNSNLPQYTGIATTLGKELLSSRLRGNMCDYCVQIIELLKRMYMDKEAEAEISQILKDTVCPQLSYLQSLCNLFIDNYVPEILQGIATRTDPRKFCIDSEYCPPTSASTAAVPKEQQNYWLQFLERIALRVRVRPSDPPKSKSSLVRAQPVGESLCQYCLEFFNVIKSAIMDKDLVADMTHSTEQVCDVLVHLRDQCVQWVRDNFASVVATEAPLIDPNAICVASGSCSPTKQAPGNSGLVTASKQQQSLRVSDSLCTMCQMVVKLVREQLSNATVREEILQYVKDQFCIILPQDKDACDHAVDTYGPIILLLMQSRMDPLGACQMITLCPKNATGLTAHSWVAGLSRPADGGPAVQSTLACQLCLIGFNYFQAQVRDDNATRAQIVANAESWCDVLAPPANRTACHQFIHSHTIEVLLDIDANLLFRQMDSVPR